jgi:hypothetical protein
MTDAVAIALGPVRDLLRLDGADIELVSVDDAGTAHLRLLLVEAGCAECVLPKTMLEGVALQMMQSAAPGLQSVTIDDPREA